MKQYITSDNIAMFARVQGAANYGGSRDVAIMWDELDSSERELAENIDIDVTVYTSEPETVPKKWKDDIIEEESEPDEVDMVKQIIANPARSDVYEMLVKYDPPEPLILWWLDKTFADPEYFDLLADACTYSLFRGDNRYFWAVVAYGVDAGVGSFHWPESSEDPDSDLKDELLEQYSEISEKELAMAWDDVSEIAETWLERSGGGEPDGDALSQDPDAGSGERLADDSRDRSGGLLDL